MILSFFHQIHLVETKSWSITLLASSYPLFALSVTGVTFGAGWIVDRFSTVHLLRFFLLPLAFGLLLIASTDKTYAVYIFMILIGATAFGLVFRGMGGDKLVLDVMTNLPAGVWGFLFVSMLLIFILGFFLDFLQICFIVVPILAPIATEFGIDLLWFAVLIAINLQTSFLTPPFGFSLFYLKAVAPPNVRIQDIYSGIIPFVILQLITIMLLIFIPELITWLPNLMDRMHGL